MPSPSCLVCAKVIRYGDVRCAKCQTPFHIKCAAGYDAEAADAAAWLCVKCCSPLSREQPLAPKPGPLTTDHFAMLMNQLGALTASVERCNTVTEETNKLVAIHSQQIADCISEIDSLKTENALLKAKMRELEDRSNAGTSMPSALTFSEIQRRINRQRNLIVRGVPEDRNVNILEFCQTIFSSLLSVDNSGIISAVRIGNLGTGRLRLIRVTFSEVSTKYAVLGKKKYLDRQRFPNIEIQNDLTIQQSRRLRVLREELKIRRRNGELNLFIKYIDDEPTIEIGGPDDDAGRDLYAKRQRDEEHSPRDQPTKQSRVVTTRPALPGS